MVIITNVDAKPMKQGTFFFTENNKENKNSFQIKIWLRMALSNQMRTIYLLFHLYFVYDSHFQLCAHVGRTMCVTVCV